ncbi:probable polyol transporter 6 [Selaginella moellendorffii]|uniref:probable polyol transporter 6 n=1 Tax=Selaginella moellendorffii TaxID=88036 RepID=UPI000D1CB171|nr:probable polyol transporter 6 [Selaginella moellendorffii]|eukprot:XP_024532900.1 probable polyol transporter 6 [Selaginella moellendorffii]
MEERSRLAREPSESSEHGRKGLFDSARNLEGRLSGGNSSAPGAPAAPAAEAETVPGRRKKNYNKYVVFCTLLASLNSILLGYDIGVTSGALLYIKDDFKLNSVQQEMLVGILNLVSLVGGLMAGKLADAVGRRKTMATASVIFFVGALLMALSPSYAVLMGARVLSGVGVGFAMIIAPVYTAELSPPGSRGSLVSFAEVFINTGILVGYVANFALSPLPQWLGWRLMLGLGAVPAVFLACAVLVMPESPRWLVMQGRVSQAKTVLIRTCGGNKGEAESRLTAIVESLGDEYEAEKQEVRDEHTSKMDPEADHPAELRKLPSVASSTTEQRKRMLKAKKKAGSNVWKQLLLPSAPVRRMLLVSLGIHFFQQASGVDALVYYSPTVFAQAGMKSRTSVLGMTIAVGLTKTLFILVATIYLDTVGRRTLLLASATGMTIALTTVAVTFRFLHVGAKVDMSSSQHASVALVVIAMLAICGFMASFSIGLGPTVYVLTSEIFPLTLRARAMSLSIGMNRGISGTVALTYLSLAEALTTSGAFFVYASIAFASIVFVFFVVPETKGKSLEEVCKYFGWQPDEGGGGQELREV